MMRFPRLVTGLAVCLLIPTVCLAQNPFAPKKKVIVEGWADIKDGNLAAARDAAIKSGLKQAVEMTAGVHIKSIMSDSTYSKMVDDKEKYLSEVKSKIYSKSEGFIGKHRILKESNDGKVFKMTLEVEVKDGELERQLSILAKRLAGARFPKIVVMVKELFIDKTGKKKNVRESTLQALIENALLARGFDLVAQERIFKLRKQESEVFEEFLNDDNKAAKFAMEFGAEYIITAVARIKYTSFNDLGQKEHHAFAELTLKAINSSTAAIVASHKKGGNSPANCFSIGDLKIKAVTHVAPPLIDNLLMRIVQSWDQETSKGIRYSVKLYNVKSYRKQGIKFIKVVRTVPKVMDVKKLSYGGGRLEIEIFYPVKYDVSALEEAILEALDGIKAFAKLDVTYSRGRELNFKL